MTPPRFSCCSSLKFIFIQALRQRSEASYAGSPIPNRQLIVETHSDHLIDRIRMDIRDGATELKPEDVSILFFERQEIDVRIHSLTLDELGNVNGAPPGYRQFFMNEMQRSLQL